MSKTVLILEDSLGSLGELTDELAAKGYDPSVVMEDDDLWHFNSHSAAFGKGKLFSSIPKISSTVLPTPPALPGLAF